MRIRYKGDLVFVNYNQLESMYEDSLAIVVYDTEKKAAIDESSHYDFIFKNLHKHPIKKMKNKDRRMLGYGKGPYFDDNNDSYFLYSAITLDDGIVVSNSNYQGVPYWIFIPETHPLFNFDLIVLNDNLKIMKFTAPQSGAISKLVNSYVAKAPRILTK